MMRDRFEPWVWLFVAALFLSLAYAVFSTAEAHGNAIEEPRVCRGEFGHKKVPCP